MVTFGSLFAGIGGFDLGFERAGMTCKWQVEIDPFCRKALAKHWPSVRRHDDIRTFPTDEACGVDVICGGFPCKQTSTGAAVHGRRSGLDGKDSGLWWEFLRVVNTIKPIGVVIENPSGVKKWATTIEGCLADAGYGVQRHELEAADFGAPHQRRRVFWIANRDIQGLQVARRSEPRTAQASAWRAFDGNAWVPTIPRSLRVADGVPGGMDRRARIAALGNSLVPACAEWIGRRLMQVNTNLQGRA